MKRDAAGGQDGRDLLDGYRHRDLVGQRRGVEEVQAVKAHALKRILELGRGILLGPELPPQLVGHGDRVALGAHGAEQLPEEHLRVP
ncbi:MAG TPA: hypothetical protein VE571_13000 [Solirubrobacteraceae bacterium]|jgi:hypothetical protein|nr:hypothetical protein [Solirubrobacteraceae bacterium]